jgi:hypothetical protein
MCSACEEFLASPRNRGGSMHGRLDSMPSCTRACFSGARLHDSCTLLLSWDRAWQLAHRCVWPPNCVVHAVLPAPCTPHAQLSWYRCGPLHKYLFKHRSILMCSMHFLRRAMPLRRQRRQLPCRPAAQEPPAASLLRHRPPAGPAPELAWQQQQQRLARPRGLGCLLQA